MSKPLASESAERIHRVRTRIADSNENCFPRSLVLLLEEAVHNEKNFSTEYSSEIVLRPKSLIDAFPTVSNPRVDEVRNEYLELEEPLGRLQGERSPIDENRLSDIWNVQNGELSLRIREMVEAGILKERSRPIAVKGLIRTRLRDGTRTPCGFHHGIWVLSTQPLL